MNPILLQTLVHYMGFSAFGSPSGIRTRVASLRSWSPRPLDDGTVMHVEGGSPTYFARGQGLEP